MVKWTIDRSGIYLCNATVLFLEVFVTFFLLLFLVCNVAIFLTSGYLDKKFIVLCHISMPSKTSWENVLSFVGDYSQFGLPPFFFSSSSFYSSFYSSFLNISNHWSWGVIITAGLKGFLGGVYYACFLVCIFELILFDLNRKNLMQSWFIDESNMLNHIIIPRNQKKYHLILLHLVMSQVVAR